MAEEGGISTDLHTPVGNLHLYVPRDAGREVHKRAKVLNGSIYVCINIYIYTYISIRPYRVGMVLHLYLYLSIYLSIYLSAI